MCLLVKALYGHPEAGAHWERHLTEIIVEVLKGFPVPGHPSTFWFPQSKLLLTVYVDDLVLSGPEREHETFWKALASKVVIDPPEDLDRYLGRHHDFQSSPSSIGDIMKHFDPVASRGHAN